MGRSWLGWRERADSRDGGADPIHFFNNLYYIEEENRLRVPQELGLLKSGSLGLVGRY